MKTVLKKRTQNEAGVFGSYLKQLQLALVMLPTDVFKGSGPAVSSTPMWWGLQTCQAEQLVPGAVVANGKGRL